MSETACKTDQSLFACILLSFNPYKGPQPTHTKPSYLLLTLMSILAIYYSLLTLLIIHPNPVQFFQRVFFIYTSNIQSVRTGDFLDEWWLVCNPDFLQFPRIISYFSREKYTYISFHFDWPSYFSCNLLILGWIFQRNLSTVSPMPTNLLSYLFYTQLILK